MSPASERLKQFETMLVLAVGPITGPITGQMVAFRAILGGLRGEVIPLDNSLEGRKGLAKGWSAARYLWLLLRKLAENHDAISVVYFTCSRSVGGFFKDLPLLTLCKVLRLPVVNHLHGADFSSFYSSLPGVLQRLVRYAYSDVKAYVVLTEGMKREFAPLGTNAVVEVVGNFVDPAKTKFDEPEAVFPTEPGPLRILYLGNLLRDKGVLDAARAVALAIQDGLRCEFRIAGAPSEQRVVDELHALLAHMPEASYLGPVYGRQKEELLGWSDVLLFPTYYRTEAFPLVILEAFSAATAVLSTTHNYIPEIVGVDNGYLLPPRDISAFAEKLLELDSNRGRLESFKRNNVCLASKYSRERYVQRLREILTAFSLDAMRPR